jgi:hypothetical protein
METSMGDYDLAAQRARAISEFTIDSLQYPETLDMAMPKTSTTRDGLKRSRLDAATAAYSTIERIKTGMVARTRGRRRASHPTDWSEQPTDQLRAIR